MPVMAFTIILAYFYQYCFTYLCHYDAFSQGIRELCHFKKQSATPRIDILLPAALVALSTTFKADFNPPIRYNQGSSVCLQLPCNNPFIGLTVWMRANINILATVTFIIYGMPQFN